MTDSPDQKGSNSGLVWLLFGAFFLLGAIPIARPRFVSDSDPGPRAIPLCLSIILLTTGIAQTGNQLRESTRQRRGRDPSRVVEQSNDYSRLAIGFFFSLWIYLAGIWLAGFILATLLYATLSMRVLGTRWSTAGVVSLLLTGSIYLLFQVVFAVVLPLGWIWG